MKINMGMKTLLASVAIAGALASTPASATQFMGNVSANYNSNDNNGLGVDLDWVHSAFNFTLNNVGDHYTMSLFNLFTDESSVDTTSPSDKIAKAISVAFDFSKPTANPDTVTISGTTQGVTVPDGSRHDYEYGLLTWASNGIGAFAFGNGGLLQIDLGGDTIFNYGRDGLDGLGDCDGSAANVNATFTLEHLSTAVPEPYEWALMLLGVGMVGATLRQDRRRAVVTA